MLAPRVEIQNQILGHAVAVAGTSFSLHYRSDRVPGRRAAYQLTIPLRNGQVPAGVKEIVLEVEIAGQRLRERLAPGAEPRYTFCWDGKDGTGQPVRGKQTAVIRLGYVYPAVYPRPELTRWQERRRAVGVWDARVYGLGGWTLSAHHVYDRVGRVLYLGNGHRRSRIEVDNVTEEVLIPEVALEEVYVFDREGRHLRTVHGLTGGLLYRFAYDAAGRLDAVEDAEGNRTSIERAASGAPMAIVGPWGRRTVLTTDGDGYISEITNALGEGVRCGYEAGLLTRMTDPRGGEYRIRYDQEGRVIQIEDPAGGGATLARKENGSGRMIAHVTPGGRESTYRIEPFDGDAQRQVSRCCGSGELEVVSWPDGR